MKIHEGLGAQLDVPSDWRPGGHGFDPRRGQQHSFVEIDHEIFSKVILSLWNIGSTFVRGWIRNWIVVKVTFSKTVCGKEEWQIYIIKNYRKLPILAIFASLILKVNVFRFRTRKFLTKWQMQTMQNQIRRSSLIRVYTVCHSTKHF